MKLIKNIIVAFSLYSQIPMPHFEWKEEDMKHNIIFLPLVGLVIGLIIQLAIRIFGVIELPLICRVSLCLLVPLVITGGFHLDGYMDVMDALKSYKSKEEKLVILKDPHIGAFAVIRLLILSLIWLSGLSVILSNNNIEYANLFCMIFSLGRAVSTLSSLKLKHARKNGMLQMETGQSSKWDFVVCAFEMIVLFALAGMINITATLVLIVISVVHFWFYRTLSYKQFGGITGDTAGFCIVTLEEYMIIGIALCSLVL